MYRFLLSCCLFLFVVFSSPGNSWEEALRSKTAQLDLLWFTSHPFIYPDADGNLTGLEYEIVLLFQSYIKDQYGVDVSLNWKQADSFYGILETIKASDALHTVGVSAFSITDERKKYVKFTDPTCQT